MRSSNFRRPALSAMRAAILIAGLSGAFHASAAPTSVQINGEINRITLNSPGDYWSGGTIVIGGQYVTIPRNLLIDLPANRLTLWQLFDQAPASCRVMGETGLASSDRCNTGGFGGIASISANRTNGGNIIAGDMLIEKGQEVVAGVVTYIDHDQGFLRVNGIPGDAATGVLARMNDDAVQRVVLDAAERIIREEIDKLKAPSSANPR